MSEPSAVAKLPGRKDGLKNRVELLQHCAGPNVIALTCAVGVVGAILLSRPYGGVVKVAGAGGVCVAIAFIAGASWKGWNADRPRHDLTRDLLFADRGVVVRADEGAAEQKIVDGEIVGLCHRIGLTLPSLSGSSRTTFLQRCDLSERLWSWLKQRRGQGVDVVVMPDEVWKIPDYRYLYELDASAVARIRERSAALATKK